MTPRSGCVCPSRDARACHLFRCGEFGALEDEAVCPCRCHYALCRVCGAVGPLDGAGWCVECRRWDDLPDGLQEIGEAP